ncbi:uncharacterized protein DSM5745_09025 [Aspergillus mulundensis]|uniref:Uncharacterized protein n=1 Tax=Aspergillus mulundensis TaxID=1810919 RepID=A0A3D8QZF1_9EURO|nr:hypothetical protein DSM5745_09025 [Aspergillus mulundensis]RDW67159.1 hypothetical protein DSM5745_09025 [Aspergillus mulundensis]
MAQTRTSIRGLPRVSAPPQAISLQTRSLWGCSYHRDNKHNLHRKHIRLILHSHPQSRKPHRPTQNWDQRTIYPDYHYQSWRGPGWGWGWSSFRPSFPDSQSQRKEIRGKIKQVIDEIDAWNDDARRRMEWIRREIERDPYAAVFGRRIEPFGLNWGTKLENGFTTLWQSIFGARNGGDTDASKKAEKTTKIVDLVGKEQKDSPSADDSVKLEESHTGNSAVQSRFSGGVRGIGFEYDPITGRMIPVRTKSSSLNEDGEESQRDVQGSEHTSNEGGKESQRDSQGPGPTSSSESDTLPRANAETGSDGLSKSDSTIEEGSIDPEVLKRPGNASEPSIIYEGQVYASSPSQKTYDDIPEAAQNISEESGAGPRTHGQDEPTMPPENDSDDALPRDTIRSSQTLDIGNQSAVQTSKSEPSISGDGLDRVGFLSRRDQEGPLWNLGRTQPSIETENREEGLEQLSARDIRAAYEPRRLSIESEIEAETPKNFDGNSNLPMGSVDEHGTSFQDQTENSTDLPDMPTVTKTSKDSTEQALSGDSAAPAASLVMNATPAAETYRIFAYDPSSTAVTEAETISSLQAPNEPLHPTEVLTRLTNPAKFLPCLNQMNADGYEIVSGGGDILVFRKAPAKRPTASNPGSNHGPASLTEDHSSEAVAPQPIHNNFYTGNLSSQSSSTEHFRGSSPESKVRTVLRRMLIGGLATGSTCYALGVVSEYFRTGGEDGQGIDAFTQFESERRHRER